MSNYKISTKCVNPDTIRKTEKLAYCRFIKALHSNMSPASKWGACLICRKAVSFTLGFKILPTKPLLPKSQILKAELRDLTSSGQAASFYHFQSLQRRRSCSQLLCTLRRNPESVLRYHEKNGNRLQLCGSRCRL